MGLRQWLISKITIPAYKKEMARYIDMISAMDYDERLFLYTGVETMAAEFLLTTPYNFWRPFEIIAESPFFFMELKRFARELQKQKNLPIAACAIVWLHTFRGVAFLELRNDARNLWAVITEGMEEGEARYPDGLTPHPI